MNFNHNLGIVIQARMGSTRFPGKVLQDFCGKPMLLFQVDLLDQYDLGFEIVVATSDNMRDDAVVQFCDVHGINCVRGSENDVLRRFQLVVQEYAFDHVVRLTGDNPLVNYRILTGCIEAHGRSGADLTTTRRIFPDRSIERYAPKGNSVDVMNAQTLLMINSWELDDYQREHVIPVFFNDKYNVNCVREFGDLKMEMTIDTADDLEKMVRYTRQELRKGTLLQSLGF